MLRSLILRRWQRILKLCVLLAGLIMFYMAVRRSHLVQNEDSLTTDTYVHSSTASMHLLSTFEEDEFAEFMDKIVYGLGEDGKAAFLTGEEHKQAMELMKTEAFNLLLSDKISYDRSIPDVRTKECQEMKYDNELPQASIIVIFTNEAFSTLIRTVHSLINRTPDSYLYEIILVDDFSDRAVHVVEVLGKTLYRYLMTRLPPKVKLLRLKPRHGIMRARTEGAKFAKGEVLIFLESHCEASPGWIEPLLARIKENPKAVVIPRIDGINDATLEYHAVKDCKVAIGGFTWSGHFTLMDVPEYEKKRKKSECSPTRSPTMPGGLLGISRSFFFDIGAYDPGMEIWGGENLELSFRVWMCGGTLEIIPCSRVGHIYRSFHPYTFPGKKDTHGINTARMAHVWMDDYAKFFFLARPEYEKGDVGNLSDRKKLRKDLQCHDFKWFLDNIYPEKFIYDEDSTHWGRVISGASKDPQLCLDMLQRFEKERYNLAFYACHPYDAYSQFFSLSKLGELRREYVCAEIEEKNPNDDFVPVVMDECHGKKGLQEWEFTSKGKLIHVKSKRCLDSLGRQSGDDVVAAKCTDSPTQIWRFTNYR